MYKVLQINININKGSTGKIVEQISNLVLQEGWESYVAVSAFGKPNPSKSVKYIIGTKASYYEHAIETLLLDNHGLASRWPTKQLLHYIDRINPDIIHIHNIHGFYLNYDLLMNYLSTLKIPIVLTLHDCWTFTGHCAHFIKARCTKWVSGCHHCPLKKDYPSSWIRDNSSNNWKLKRRLFTSINNITIVPVSNWLYSQVKQSFLGVHPMHVIQNGIDLNIFQPRKTDIRRRFGLNKEFVVLGVANAWSVDKGLNDYIKLSESLPDSFKILMVGLKKNQIEKMPSTIICVERTKSQEELAEFYSMADVLTSLSYGESMGLTIVEGMACGTPAIVYNNTAQVDLVTDNTGISVETGDIGAVVKALLRLQQNGKERYVKPCVDFARSNFNKDLRFKQYIDLYKNILAHESINSNNLL